MATSRAVRALAVSGALVALATGCGGGEGGSALGVGESTVGPGRVEGDAVVVRVPSGSITVTIGAPEQSVTTGEGTVSAPAGGALVTVAWSIDRYQTADVTGFDQDTELALVTDAGDGTAPVVTIPDTDTAAVGSRVVAVDGDAPVTAVTATYDGVEQRLDLDGTRDAGVAEALYAPTAAGERADCSRGWALRARAQVEVRCIVQAWTLPYLPDVGWAEDGTTHVLVEPVVSLTGVSARGTQYRAAFSSATATLGGDEVDTPVDAGPAGASSFTARLRAQSTTLPVEWGVRARFVLRGRNGGGPLGDTAVVLSGGSTVAPTG